MSSSVSLSALSALAVIIAAPAFAQDAPNWNGGYFGANISWGNGSVDADGELLELLSEFGVDSTIAEPSGTTGAIRGGYDWESSMLLFGVGAEYSFGEYDGGLEGIFAEAADELGVGDLSFGIEQMVTVFARAGMLANDNLLVYGLVGWSWGDLSASLDGESGSESVDGYTLGVGGEYLFNQNWAAYGEYAYTGFDEVDNTLGLLEADTGIFKLGLNYRF